MSKPVGYYVPTSKVTAAGLGGALSTVVLGVLSHNGIEVDYPGFDAAVTTAAMFGIAYFVPERRRPPEIKADQ